MQAMPSFRSRLALCGVRRSGTACRRRTECRSTRGFKHSEGRFRIAFVEGAMRTAAGPTVSVEDLGDHLEESHDPADAPRLCT